MTTIISLQAIVTALGKQADDQMLFLDRATGRLINHTSRKSGETKTVLPPGAGENRVQLPTRWEIHINNIKENFCLSFDYDELKSSLFFAIKGFGALNRFSDCIEHFGLEKQWKRYRTDALKAIATDWCRQNGVDFQDDVDS